eukprot:SAG22_NODE_16089_length_333_cov_0.666667_1_plen_84_part_10
MGISVELRQLRFFLCVVDHRSVAAAARVLNIAQPAIDLTLAEGARGVGGQRTALVLPLQPRLHPPVSPPVCAPLDTAPAFAQPF